VHLKLTSVLVVGGATLAAVAGATAAAAPETTERPRGDASLGSYGRDGRHGLTVDAETRESSLKRISVRFVRGAEIRLERRSRAYDFAAFWLGETTDSRALGGRLQVPAGKASGRFELRFRRLRNGFTQPAPVTARLRTGRKPSLVITGLPAGTTGFHLITRGAGTRGTKATFCKDEFVRYRGTMRIVLASGARGPGDATGRYSCANLPPQRCQC
jgi:hypothetical protein